MREYPVFVPFDGEHLAAVLTVPDDEPRGLVLLLPGGGGAPRSHRFGMWTRAARALADRDIASVRMEWRGVGDSTGRARFGFRVLPAEDVAAVARFAMRATGLTRLGLAGNCMGARTALRAASLLPGVESVVLMLVKPLAGTRSRHPALVRSRLMIRRLPAADLLRRVVLKRKRLRAGPMMSRIIDLRTSAHVLLLETLRSERVGDLPRLVSRLQRQNGRHRLELRDLPGGEKRAFHRLERQRFVVDSVVEWFDETFPPAAELTHLERAPERL